MTNHLAAPTQSEASAEHPPPASSSSEPVAARLLSAEEIAGMLGVAPSFVYALARRGAIPSVRLGERYVRFRPRAVERWLSELEQAPTGRRA